MRIYCAGPLFNRKEKEEMEEIAQALEKEGFGVFLPQRDGLEFAGCIDGLIASGLDQETASDLLMRAIYALDVYQVIEGCDAIVVNLNGRVPDEGAVAEAALAWYAGKTLVGYKSDVRSLIRGCDNPLVLGLFDFKTVATIADLVSCVKTELTGSSRFTRSSDRKREIEECLNFGQRIWDTLRDANRRKEVVSVLLENTKMRA